MYNNINRISQALEKNYRTLSSEFSLSFIVRRLKNPNS